MTPATTVRPQILQLPATAQLVRITAGMGSVGQKTWNLRRPVTLLGGRRPAHIVLHDPKIADAHCVIINTGSEILLKDLHTDSGTARNDSRIDLTALHDGDVIQLGETKIQVAIQKPNNPNATDWNIAPSEKLPRFSPPCTYSLEGIDKRWEVQDPAILLGSHEDAAIHLEHADISTRHAVIFRFCDAPAVFDLGSRYGLHVNDQRCSLTSLHHGDTIKAGPFSVHLARIPSDSGGELIEQTREEELTIQPPASELPSGSPPQDGASAEILSRDLSSSWKGFNSLETKSRPSDLQDKDRQDSLASWEKELDKKEAVLRGKLHDLERYNELIQNREHDTSTLCKRNNEESRRLINERDDLNSLIADAEKKEADLQRRETAVAQRWARMKSMSCTQCGRPVQSEPPPPRLE